MIHVIGDSHCSVFGGVDYMQPTWPNYIDEGAAKTSIRQNLLPNIRQYRLGPCTAYNLYKRIPEIYEIIKKECQPNDVIFLSAGEIDIREHIGRIAGIQGISIKQSVTNTINNFVKVLEFIKDQGFKSGVVRPHIAVWDYDDAGKLEAVEYMNQELKSYCENNSHYHIGAFDFINKDPKFYFDGLHLSQECRPYFEQQLREIGLWT